MADTLLTLYLVFIMNSTPYISNKSNIREITLRYMGQGMRKRALGCSRIFSGLASKINYREKAENLEIVEAWDFPNASKSGDVGA